MNKLIIITEEQRKTFNEIFGPLNITIEEFVGLFNMKEELQKQIDELKTQQKNIIKAVNEIQLGEYNKKLDNVFNGMGFNIE